MRLLLLVASALTAGVYGEEDDLLTIASVLFYAFRTLLRGGPEAHYPTVTRPKVADAGPKSVPGTPFEGTLYESVNTTEYLLAVSAPGEEPWQVYSVKDLLGQKGFFTCDNVVYSDWHHSNWGTEPYRSFLHWQAEWHKTTQKECYFVMSQASESPPGDGMEYFGRYPAGLQLMYLINTGVIQCGHDPWLLYVDTDIFFTRPGDVVNDILGLLRGAVRHPNGTLEDTFTHGEPKPLQYEDLALVVASDPGCAFKRDSKWPRFNSGTLLFRPVPYVAYVFDATVQSWLLKRKHKFDRLDQAMLTAVLTDSFDFPHQTLRRMCRSDTKPWITLGADVDLWRDACEGSQLVFTRALDYARASAVLETRQLLEKWLPSDSAAEGPQTVALACNRLLGGSLAGTPWWVSNDLWEWQCGDAGMHIIGGMGIYGAKYRTLVARWREKHFAECTEELAIKTMLDGSPILPLNVVDDAKRLHPRLGANGMKPFTAKEKYKES